MNFKTLSLILLVLHFLYGLFLELVEYRSSNNPTPENVRDIYDAETYARWKNYQHEKCRISLLSHCLSFVITFVLFCTNLYARISGIAGESTLLAAICVILFSELADICLGLPLSWYDTMVIEEKYGFNRSTAKTFWLDQLKSFLISTILIVGLVWAFIAIHKALGDMVLVLFAIILFALILVISFLYPFFSKIFNKFVPLEDGELKEKLTCLLEKNGYKVRAIQVMDASRRSSKSNAYFTGFGKMKTIVLYDTLVSSQTPDEICAVFAHEMGHGLHKDTQKNQILSFLNTCILAVLIWLTVRYPGIYQDFGFNGLNYGFAFLLMSTIEMPLLSPLLGLLTNAYSRKAEYRADATAVREGYGLALVSALKKLSRENFSNLSPSPLLVKLTYSHPPISARIQAIVKEMK